MTSLLFVASEAFPLVKTGGLADVAGSLPASLREMGLDVRLLLPAYADLLAGLAQPPKVVAAMELGGEPVQLLATGLPGTQVPVLLLAHPSFSERGGNPYHDGAGNPWPDNPERFMLLSRAAARLCSPDSPLDWRPDVLHCNDWHTAPAIALVHEQPDRPGTVFTIHSLAHMGVFDRATFERLGLPPQWWSTGGLEFYGQFAFIKGGLAFADAITTVSPTYAREICESPGGMGLEGLLSARRDSLFGILNGIQGDVWDPRTDPHLAQNYTADSLDAKAANKAALQRELGLQSTSDLPLLGFVGRLFEQKGLELMLPVLEQLLATPAQVAILGKGDARYEARLRELDAAHQGAMAVVFAYNEGLAHRIEAAADIFLMPSLFEPCGLNQLYSLRYGTPPVVRAVGGLADTVIDAGEDNLAAGRATGFVFSEPHPEAFLHAVARATTLWRDRERWEGLQRTAMAQDFSWEKSAERYLELYAAITVA